MGAERSEAPEAPSWEPNIRSGIEKKKYRFVKVDVFDEGKLSRRVLDRTWPNLAAKRAEHDPKMAPQNDPKSTKNRRQTMIKILNAFKPAGTRFLDQTGGMRSPQGGTLGRSKNSAKEDLQ